MSKARYPQPAALRARMAGGRRGEFGGLSSGFLTLSVLLLVMALGFVFGRVVVARAYIKEMPAIGKHRPGTPAASTQEDENAPQVVYGQSSVPDQTPAASTPTPMNPNDVPSGDTTAGSSDSTTDASRDTAAADSGDTTSSDSGDVRYAVQVGVFSSEDRARQAEDQLTRAGYSARIEVTRDSSQTSYRVLAGRYHSETNARKALDQIQHEGFSEAFVVGQ